MLSCVSPARGDNEDLSTLELFDGNQHEIVSTGRSPRPASLIAENVTVITSKEIEALNAHTLTDVLYTVPGIQLQMTRTPGTVANLTLQGSQYNHVLVLVDNVPINNLTDNFPDISSVPVQIIERIEIIKGAASSSWGNALGGVVNVITKSPPPDSPVSGEVSASAGSRGTEDYRAELGGSRTPLGYYAFLGRLDSAGLLPHNGVRLDNGYGKLQYDISSRSVITLSTLYTHNSNGQGVFPGRTADVLFQQVLSTLTLQSSLTDRLSLQASIKDKEAQTGIQKKREGTLLADTEEAEADRGVSLNLGWRGDRQRVSLGLDYQHLRTHVSMPMLRTPDLLNRSADHVGVYLNDVFTMGRLSLIPSARFDHTGVGSHLFNPSFGVTYTLSDKTVLRGYTARGYSLTSLLYDNSEERVWTSQVGFESGEIPFFWLKGTLFRNDTWNILSRDHVTKERLLKQGGEVELRTLPLFHTSLSLGYTYIHALDTDNDQNVDGIPRHTLKFGVSYDDSRYLSALLNVNYMDWNVPPGEGTKNGMIWDLHLTRKVVLTDRYRLELFLSVRNLFDSKQYLSVYYQNPGRWAEGGVRCHF